MEPGPFHSPATHALRYDLARFKASHNSYAKKISLKEQLTFHRNRPHERGFRGLELDVHQDTKGCDWCVRHLVGECARLHRNRGEGAGMGPDCLGDWFQELALWSESNPEHDVITLTLDLKRIRRPETFPDDFDALLAGSGLDRDRLFTPSDRTGDWPTLGDLTGRFIACLSGLESVKSAYARQDDRLCFADLSLGPGDFPPPDDPRLFLNYNWREYERDQGNVFGRPVNRPYIVRAYSLRKDPALGSWDVAERAGVNVMCTEWLRRLAVGPEPFAPLWGE